MNKQFEEWYFNLLKNHNDGHIEPDMGDIDFFNGLPFSMQWGVYLEFFDSVGIYVDDDFFMPENYRSTVVWYEDNSKKNLWINKRGVKTRTEAQQEAIKKAFKILEQ